VRVRVLRVRIRVRVRLELEPTKQGSMPLMVFWVLLCPRVPTL
jgi:hypothetical protein